MKNFVCPLSLTSRCVTIPKALVVCNVDLFSVEVKVER